MNADRNKIELSGRLVRDIKLAESKAGSVYGIITILIRSEKDLDHIDAVAKRAEFFEIFIWNKKLLDAYGAYLKSGKRVAVRGFLSRTKDNFYINVTEDYGIAICLDIRDLKKGEKGSLAWVAALEEENEKYEQKLKIYEEKLNNNKGE